MTNIAASTTIIRTTNAPIGNTADMDIPTKIRQARTKAGLTQADLAKAMGVGQSAVSQWEGDIIRPSLENRVLLATKLGIPFAELLPEAEEIAGDLRDDPQLLQVVYNYLRLPPSMRTAVLLNVLGLLQALEGKG